MLTQNLGREVAQLNEQRLGAQSTHTSRINSVSQGAGVGFGDILGSAVQGAQLGISSASSISTIQKNKAVPKPEGE